MPGTLTINERSTLNELSRPTCNYTLLVNVNRH